MVYPDNFENKIGFDRIRSQVKALCVTQGAVDKLFEAAFSDDYESVVARLGQVFEMRTVLMMDNGLPEGSFVDMDAFLKKGPSRALSWMSASWRRCAKGWRWSTGWSPFSMPVPTSSIRS